MPATRRRSSITIDKLRFPQGRLYGRDVEERALQDAYRQMVQDKRGDGADQTNADGQNKEMVMVTGNSGVGKTSLVQSLRARVRGKRKDFFISGKYDLMENMSNTSMSTPYSAIIDALSDLPEQMHDAQIGSALQKKIGREVCSVVVRCIPALKWVLFPEEEEKGYTDEVSVSGSIECRNQFNFAFRTFIRRLCEENKKIMVLFLDDLQWADAASLELLEILATDKENSSLLIVGSYRENEVNETHPLSTRLKQIDESEVVNLKFLPIDDLDCEVLNTMISDTLNMTLTETEPLTNIVHQKTNGNPFFVKQFLEALCDDDALQFSFGMTKWTWNMGRINGMHLTNNVVDLLLTKMRKVPAEQSQMLSLSSCLGSCFDLAIMVIVVDFLHDLVLGTNASTSVKEALRFLKLSPDNVRSCVDKNISDGLLEDHASSLGQESFRFTHDQIQAASFSFIPEESREILQWCVGQAFVKKLHPSQLDQVLFGAVDLLNNGRNVFLSSHSDNNQELLRLAKLNLGAGLNAMSIAAFRQSTIYLQISIECLIDVSDSVDLAWLQHHDLCLEAYSALAESSYCNCDFEVLESTVDTILEYTASKQGKMKAYSILVKAYCTRDKFREAFDTAFIAFSEFGETFPRKPGTIAVVTELLRTKRFMNKYPVEKLQNLPQLDDPSKIIMMKMFIRLTAHAYLECPEYLPLIVFRMVKWSCLFGVCSATPAAFALYGLLVAGAVGDLKVGYGYAMVAETLMEKDDDKSEIALTCLVVSMVKSNQEPILSALKGGFSGYQIGMEQGDNFYAMLNLVHKLLNALLAGQSLFSVGADMRLYVPHFADHGQIMCYKRMLPFWQFVIIIMGSKEHDSPPNCELTGELMSESSYLQQFKNDIGHVTATLVYKQFLSYYLGTFELAAQLSDKTQDYPKKYAIGHFPGVRYVFFDGLTAMAMLSMHKRRWIGNQKWQKRKSRSIKKMASWKKQGNVNINHMLLLLEAEAYSLKRKADMGVARSKFDAAISAAAKTGFAHDNALANERAGAFCLKHDDSYWANKYITRAHQGWAEYGALAICLSLEERYPQYITEEVKNSSMRAFLLSEKRSKKRRNMSRKSIVFKDATDSWSDIRATTLNIMFHGEQRRKSSSSVSNWSNLNVSELLELDDEEG